MKKLTIFFLIYVISISGFADDIECGSDVTVVMDYPQKCLNTDGTTNTAFKSSKSSKWICPPSKTSNALVLTALATGKRLGVYIDDSNGSSCSNISDYTKARYIVIYP